MNPYCWLALFFVLSVLVARSFCYFGVSGNGGTGEGVDPAAAAKERALAAAWARRFATKDLQ